jgi:tRNA(Ile)-lysidine synthase
VRPLLDRSRAEVLRYLGDRGLPWTEDPSNASPRFLRNRIRRELLPLLESLTPSVESRLCRMADLLRDDDRALEALARSALGGAKGARVEVERLAKTSAAVRRRAVRRLWRAASGSRRGLAARHVESVLRLTGRAAPGKVALPGGLEARVGYGSLEIGAAAPPVKPFDPVQVTAPGAYRIPGQERVVEIGWTAATAPAPWPLEVRTRRQGDRFCPAGGRGGKKLKAWLIDRKVPRPRRDALLVVAAEGGKVLCIPELGAVAAGAAPLQVRILPG